MAVDTPGRLIAGKYELVTEAGSGGMAVVWKAIARDANARPVAVKRIQNAKHADPAFIKMFEEEARVGAEIHHPNVVQILDFGMDDAGDYYLVMEWVEGLDMFHWMSSFPRDVMPTPWALVSAIGIEVCRALGAAHERVTVAGDVSPVYHRDVSPSNVLLGTNGVVKLTDFGLARAMDRASMTRPNVIKGKLAYSAPELISGGKPSPQSDLFSLSVVLWEALARRRLFTGKNDLEVLLAVRKGDIPHLDSVRSDLPPSLVEVVHRGLSTDPANRFETAKSMARALASVIREHPQAAAAEPLGPSVRAARSRLGREPAGSSAGGIPAPAVPQGALPPAQAAAAAPPGKRPSTVPPPLPPRISMPHPDGVSAEEISLADMQPALSGDPAPSATSPSEPSAPSSRPSSFPRGLWKGTQDDLSGAGHALPLVTKKP